MLSLSSDVEANGKEDEAQPRAEGENASVYPTIATARNKERGDRRRYEDMVPTIWQQMAEWRMPGGAAAHAGCRPPAGLPRGDAGHGPWAWLAQSSRQNYVAESPHNTVFHR